MVPLSSVSQSSLRLNIGRLRREMSDLQGSFVVRRRDRLCREIKCELAALRIETALILWDHLRRKAGFKPDQPRWPKGSGEDSGRWSGGAGGTESGTGAGQTTDFSAMRRKPGMPGLTVPHIGVPSNSPAYTPGQVKIINNAQTGISTVDETTEKLKTILEKAVNGRPEGFGPAYGRAIHYDFADAVKSEDLRGIGQKGVEQTYGPDPDNRDVRYGSKNSIRTDVALRNDVGDVIAIYDVKTGDASLGPRRVQELRDKTRSNLSIPVIEMHVRRGLSLKSEAAKETWIITLRLWNPWIRELAGPAADGNVPAAMR